MRIGYLEGVFGGMFSGKTAELFERLGVEKAAGTEIVLCVHASNVKRDGEGKLKTHNQAQFEAHTLETIDEVADLARKTRLRVGRDRPITIGIDEVEFFGGDILATCVQLTLEGFNVVVVALDSDHRGANWESIIALMLFPGCVKTFKYAICTGCRSNPGTARERRTACWSTKIGGTKGQRKEVGDDIYRASCNECHPAYRAAANDKT